MPTKLADLTVEQNAHHLEEMTTLREELFHVAVGGSPRSRPGLSLKKRELIDDDGLTHKGHRVFNRLTAPIDWTPTVFAFDELTDVLFRRQRMSRSTNPWLGALSTDGKTLYVSPRNPESGRPRAFYADTVPAEIIEAVTAWA